MKAKELILLCDNQPSAGGVFLPNVTIISRALCKCWGETNYIGMFGYVAVSQCLAQGPKGFYPDTGESSVWIECHLCVDLLFLRLYILDTQRSRAL